MPGLAAIFRALCYYLKPPCWRPRVKCNTNKKGEKICHVPGSLYYRSVIIRFRKGDFYTYTETRANELGYRSPKVHKKCP
jgi:hypothetical protein